MNKSFDEEGAQFAWDATSIELAQTCPRKYYYSMILGIQPKHKSVHLIFGGIYAACLEEFYRQRFDGVSIEDALRSVVRKAMIDSWDFENGIPVAFEDSKKTRPNLIRTIVWYIEQYALETDDGLKTYQLKNGKPAVELSFTFEVDEGLFFSGHLDRVVTMGDHLYIMDQKTTGGTVGTYYFDMFSPHNQMSLYTLAGRMILDTPISGVIIDAAQIAINFTRFERGITTRSKDQLDEWLLSTMETIKRTRAYTLDHNSRDAAGAEQAFPMNLSACGNYGGCPFRPLCSKPNRVRGNFIKSDYTSRVWDPLSFRG